jgi:hypothetical protein
VLALFDGWTELNLEKNVREEKKIQHGKDQTMRPVDRKSKDHL